MSIVLGLLLGLGIVLCASPLLWPRDLERPASRPSTPGRVRSTLILAGFERLSITVFSVLSALFGLAAGALVFVIVAVPALVGVVVIVGSVVPWVIVRHRAERRRRDNRIVWPDVVDHLVAAVRAGLALPDGLSALAGSGPAPLRDAFAHFARDFQRTGDFSGCLDRLKERLADPIADRLIETLRMGREVGGTDVTRVLRALGSHLRDDAAVRSEVEARQSWVRNAARLGVVAPWIVLLVLASRPEAAAAYQSSGGAVLIVGGLAMSVVAYRIMVALGRLPAERRWAR